MGVRAGQVKIAVVAVIILIAIILILQNREPVETKILFASVTMPRAVLLLVTAGISFVAGLLTGGMMKGKRTPKSAE